MSSFDSANVTNKRDAFRKANVIATKVPTFEQESIELGDLRLHANGVFSNVYRGKLKSTQTGDKQIVIKKTWHIPKEENSLSAVIEVEVLRKLQYSRHKNIIQLLYLNRNDYKGNGQPHRWVLWMVMEWMPTTLYDFIKKHRHQMLDSMEVKALVFQLFRAQAHLGQLNIVHRDIKPQNIMVDSTSCLLKLGDFGAAEDNIRPGMPTYHVTRYYRAPELMWSSKDYSTAVDVWSCGCVMGEIFLGRVLFRGDSTQHQLQLITKVLGFPTVDEWKSMNLTLESHSKTKLSEAGVNAGSPSRVIQALTNLVNGSHQGGVQLLSSVLVYDPKLRNCAQKFLTDSWFDELWKSSNHRVHAALTTVDRDEVLHGDRVFIERQQQSRAPA